MLRCQLAPSRFSYLPVLMLDYFSLVAGSFLASSTFHPTRSVGGFGIPDSPTRSAEAIRTKRLLQFLTKTNPLQFLQPALREAGLVAGTSASKKLPRGFHSKRCQGINKAVPQLFLPRTGLPCHILATAMFFSCEWHLQRTASCMSQPQQA